jgi:hypothetical protein
MSLLLSGDWSLSYDAETVSNALAWTIGARGQSILHGVSTDLEVD